MHATLFDHFRDRFRPARDFVVTGERERRDLAVAVAFHAAAVQDARDLFRICDGAVRLRLPQLADETAGRFRRRLRNRLAGEQLFQRDFQIVPLGFVARIADAVLIVDPAVVTHVARFVQHEHFRSALGSQLIRHDVPRVFQQRERNVVNPRVRGDFRDGILRVRVDPHERHAARFEFRRQLRQPRPVQFSERTFRPQKRNDHQLVVLEFVQRMRLPAKIFQREIGDRLIRRGSLGGAGREAREHDQQGRKFRKERWNIKNLRDLIKRLFSLSLYGTRRMS